MAPTLGGRERSKNILLPRSAIYELVEYAASRAGKEKERRRERETRKIYPEAWIPVARFSSSPTVFLNMVN